MSSMKATLTTDDGVTTDFAINSDGTIVQSVPDNTEFSTQHEDYVIAVAAALTRAGFFGPEAAAELAAQEEAAGGDELYEESRAARHAADGEYLPG